MPERQVTSIEIKHSTWKRLNRRKEPGESFDDLINEALDKAEELEDRQED